MSTVSDEHASARVVAACDGSRPTAAAEEFWDSHGAALYSVACVLVAEQARATRAVALAMVDVFTTVDVDRRPHSPEALRSAARRVLWRCQEIGESSVLQHVAVAMCVFGGHTYRELAELLDVTPETVAVSLNAGLRDLRCR